MSPYREVDHTADWSLQVWAPTLEELFVDAARGMYALAGAPQRLAGAPGPEGARRQVRVQGFDPETLLVGWLQELLYLTETEHIVFDDFQVHELSSAELVAEVGGRPAEQLDKVIKAVTYHNLAIRRAESGYEVTLVFDV